MLNGKYPAVTVALALLTAPLGAHEVDPYTAPPGRDFADLGQYLTGWFFDALEQGVDRTNEQTRRRLPATATAPPALTARDVDELADNVFHAFPNAYATIEGFEHLFHSAEFQKRYPGRVVAFKTTFGQIYQGAHFPLDPRRVFKFWFASNFKAFGGYLGTDKVGHFIDMGHNYYLDYRKALRSGRSEKDAVGALLRLGTEDFIFSEAGVLGFVSAGDYSNADLSANYAGFLFYKNLTEPVKLKGVVRPAMLVRDGVYWRLAPHVRPNADFLSWFFDEHLDEALNPGLFDGSLRPGLRRAVHDRADELLWRFRDANGFTRAPQYFNDTAARLALYEGQDYGHHGGPRELITFGNTCFDPLKPGAGPDQTNNLGHTALHLAVLHNDAGAVKRLLDRGFPIDVPMRPGSWLLENEAGNTPLHLAAAYGRIEIAQLLLDRGANVNAVNAVGATPLHRAAGYPKTTRLLLDRGAKVEAADIQGRTPLHCAADLRGSSSVAVLLEAGAGVKARDREWLTPLHLAVSAGHEENVRQLLARGADPNAADRSGATPLHAAAENSRNTIARLLLERGAGVTAADVYGYTPLHLAAREGDPELAQMLLSGGGSAKVADAHGSTPLHLAARSRSRPIADLLIRSGADAGARNALGSTPLHEAAFSGDRAIVSALLAAGADPKATDLRGLSPAAIANARGHRQLLPLLGGPPAGTVYGSPRTGGYYARPSLN